MRRLPLTPNRRFAITPHPARPRPAAAAVCARPGARPRTRPMYAVIRASGKQYRVTPNAVLAVDRIEAEPGQTVTFGEVLMVGGADGVRIGAPLLSGASVAATVLEQRSEERRVGKECRSRWSPYH